MVIPKKTSEKEVYWHTSINSFVGVLGLVATQQGIRAVMWRDEVTSVRLPTQLKEDAKHPLLEEAAQQIGQYFAKKRTEFSLPLDLRGTQFQLAVWRSLQKIPYGQTLSYAEQAALIGRPKAARAVGRANGANPLPIILPCHRVLGSNKSLTGFGGGLDLKLKLLRLEAALD